MAVIFGSDKWRLNDVQVSSCHCHWGMSTVRRRVKIDNKVQRIAEIVLTDGDINYSLGVILMLRQL